MTSQTDGSGKSHDLPQHWGPDPIDTAIELILTVCAVLLAATIFLTLLVIIAEGVLWVVG